MPTRPEVWLIGRIEKPKTVRKKKTPPCGGNKLLEAKLAFSWDRDHQVPDFKTDENAASDFLMNTIGMDILDCNVPRIFQNGFADQALEQQSPPRTFGTKFFKNDRI